MRKWTAGLAVVLVAAGSVSMRAAEDGALKGRRYASAASDEAVAVQHGEFVARNFTFRDGEKSAELRLHYATLGKPIRNSAGHVVNGVMLLHGTGGSGAQFSQPQL